MIEHEEGRVEWTIGEAGQTGAERGCNGRNAGSTSSIVEAGRKGGKGEEDPKVGC